MYCRALYSFGKGMMYVPLYMCLDMCVFFFSERIQEFKEFGPFQQ
jgi:hypothetical protein